MNAWPPPYTIRISKRARYARLRISADKGLEVVLPEGMGEAQAKRLLTLRRTWIEKHQAGFASRASTPLPTEIDLPSIHQSLAIDYRLIEQDAFHIREETDRLRISGPTDDPGKVRIGLRDWLKRKAGIVLAPWLDQLSRDVELPYRKLSVRLQRTRWGSCSSAGNINLNAKLLLMEPELVRHVMVHELCHTVHMNHSPAFWALVADHDPDWQRLRKECRMRGSTLPEWVSV